MRKFVSKCVGRWYTPIRYSSPEIESNRWQVSDADRISMKDEIYSKRYLLKQDRYDHTEQNSDFKDIQYEYEV